MSLSIAYRALLDGNFKMGIYIRPNGSNIKMWEDGDFSSNSFPEEAKDDSDMECSCSRFILSYLVCRVI